MCEKSSAKTASFGSHGHKISQQNFLLGLWLTVRKNMGHICTKKIQDVLKSGKNSYCTLLVYIGSPKYLRGINHAIRALFAWSLSYFLICIVFIQIYEISVGKVNSLEDASKPSLPILEGFPSLVSTEQWWFSFTIHSPCQGNPTWRKTFTVLFAYSEGKPSKIARKVYLLLLDW